MAAPETLRVAANVLRLKGRTLLVPALATTVLLVMLVVGRWTVPAPAARTGAGLVWRRAALGSEHSDDAGPADRRQAAPAALHNAARRSYVSGQQFVDFDPSEGVDTRERIVSGPTVALVSAPSTVLEPAPSAVPSSAPSAVLVPVPSTVLASAPSAVPASAADVRSPATVRDRTFARETVTRAPGNRLVDRDLFAPNAAARPLLGLKLSGSTIGPGRSGPPAASSPGAAASPAPGPAAEPGSATAQYQLPGCACRRSYDPAAVRRLNGTRSSCGGFADLRGPGQNVISFSFYGNASSVFFGGIEANLREVPSVYPGWVVRVYHDIDLSQPGQSQLVCRVACRYDNVDFCDVRNLPGLGDLSKKFGMIWRFMPLADDTVERFIVRDLDSLIGSRERAAVDEWIASNKTFHAMRDAPAHGTEILGGMWGGWNRHNDIYRRVRQRIINSTQWKFKGLDQRVLTVVLWPHIVKHRDLIAHDSYLCWYYPMSKPFPTQRKSPRDFVGSPSLIDKGFRLKTHCSYFCRPRDHKDWVWC